MRRNTQCDELADRDVEVLTSLSDEMRGSANMLFTTSLEYDDVYVSNTYNTPCKNLLLAVLNRAVLDLFVLDTDTDNLDHKRKAIRWFLSENGVRKDSFSFTQIVQTLNISSSTAQRLILLAEVARDNTLIEDDKYSALYTRYRSRSYGSLRCHN